MLASPTLTLDSTTATLDTTLDTPMPTTERGLLMLSPSPRPRLMPSTDTTATLPILTLTATLDSTTDTEDTTTDKSSPRVQSKSSTRTSLLVNLTFHPS